MKKGKRKKKGLGVEFRGNIIILFSCLIPPKKSVNKQGRISTNVKGGGGKIFLSGHSIYLRSELAGTPGTGLLTDFSRCGLQIKMI